MKSFYVSTDIIFLYMNSKPLLQLLGACRQISETSLKCVYITGSINFEQNGDGLIVWIFYEIREF